MSWLHPQHGNFNYDSPMKCFLEAIREQKLPTDLLDVLDEAGIRYYDGECTVVYYRRPKLILRIVQAVSSSRCTTIALPQRPSLPLDPALVRRSSWAARLKYPQLAKLRCIVLSSAPTRRRYGPSSESWSVE